MDILTKMNEDLEQIKALANHGEQFKQECMSIENAENDYRYWTTKKNLENYANGYSIYNELGLESKLKEYNPNTYMEDAFDRVIVLTKDELLRLSNDKKAYFRENYIMRSVYSLRMIGYYKYLYLNKLDDFQEFINEHKNFIDEGVKHWDDDLYFFSPNMNGGSNEVFKQETVFDDELIDIEPMMIEQNEQLKKLTGNSEQLRQESIALDNAVGDYFLLKDEEYLFMIDMTIDEDYPIMDRFNQAISALEKLLLSYTQFPNAPLREVYMKRHTYSLRMLTYYFALYMKRDYDSIIEAYLNIFPEAREHWLEPLYFFSDKMNNVEPYKPRCPHCNERIEKEHTYGTAKFCSVECKSEALWLSTEFAVLQNIAGITSNEMKAVLGMHNWSLEDFAVKIDEIQEVIDKGIAPSQALISSFKTKEIFDQLHTNLVSKDVFRGGSVERFRGFIFEDLHAASASLRGTKTIVNNNNGPIDFIMFNKDGTKTFGQAKAGYENAWFDASKYDGQLFVVPKNNSALKTRLEKAGKTVIESPISLNTTTKVAELMQLERKIYNSVFKTSAKNAPITSTVISTGSATFKTGMHGGLAIAGYSFGESTVELLYGEITLQEAGAQIAKSALVGSAQSAAIGGGAHLASIALRAAASSKIGVAVSTKVAGAVATTQVGALAAGTASTISGALMGTTAGSTLLAASASIGTGIATASTAITATAASIMGATLATTTVGAFVIASAPVMVVTALAGATISLGKRLIRGY